MSKQVSFDGKLGKPEVLALFLGALEKGYVINDISWSSSTTRTAECESAIMSNIGHRQLVSVDYPDSSYLNFETVLWWAPRKSQQKLMANVTIWTSPILVTPDELNKYVDEEVYFGTYQNMQYALGCMFNVNGRSDEHGRLDFGKGKDDGIKNFDFLCRNHDLVKQLAAISWFNIDPICLPEPDTFASETTLHTLSIRNFAKLRKYSGIIKKRMKPSKEAVAKTIDLLIDVSDSLKNGESVSSSTFQIRKTDHAIIVKIGGIDLIREYSLQKYNYIVHPGIELMAAMLEHGKAFLNMQNQFNKELLKRI